MSTHRPTQRAQLFRRITEKNALIRRLGGLQGWRTAVCDDERNSALKEPCDHKAQAGYLDKGEISTRDEARRGRR